MENLKEIFLFQNLSQEELEELKKFAFLRKVRKGETVFLEGEKPQYLHLLLEGVAKVYKVDPQGKELVIHRFRPISLIAEMANIKGIPFPASCSMETDGVILKVDFQRFKKFLTDRSVCLNIIASLLDKINLLYQLVENNIGLDVETRIAKLLYENPQIFERQKQYEIAQMLNIRPETLSRKLKKFKKLGLIEKVGKKWVVKNREKLKELYIW